MALLPSKETLSGAYLDCGVGSIRSWRKPSNKKQSLLLPLFSRILFLNAGEPKVKNGNEHHDKN